MKRGLVVTLLTLLGLGAVWLSWVHSRRPASQTKSDPGAQALEPAARLVQARSPAASTEPESFEGITESEPAIEQPLPTAALPIPRPLALASMEEAPPAAEAGSVDSRLPPGTVLENVRTAFRQYQLRFHENPVGDNAEITHALHGGNPGQVTFIQPDDGLRLNAQGELVDNWGTPYFFHQLSRSEMEIRSAGADRRMWTTDDLVLK